ncbi:MAG: thiol:disulfide interchange protein DsbA/DsbL [Psychromonas sp.]
MKTLVKATSILFLSILFLSACSESNTATPTEGEQYSLLPEALPAGSLAPVTEVFSLTCGHCRKMEDFIPMISDSIGTDIGKMHVTFNQSAYTSAMFYYAAEMQLGTEPDHEFMDELFAAIQSDSDATEQQRMAELEKIFTSRGLISPFQFNEQQQQKVTHKVEQAQQLSQLSAINAVPTFVVNGRYQVIVGGHSDPQKIADTISYLLTK